jgi:hypothetical protein
MTWDPDENCVSYKELHDMMKAMTELFTNNQASTTTTYPSTISYCILTSLPYYDGFGSNKYFTWEIVMDKIFGQHRICEKRKLKNIDCALMNNVLAWWKHLCESNELPKTWNDVKILMEKTFIDSPPKSNMNFKIHSLEEEPTIASPIMHNILQEVDIKQEKEHEINELDTSIFDSPTCAEIKHLIHVTCDMSDLNLLSSLDTFGYIEYDVPCDLDIVEKRIFYQTTSPLLTRNNFHAIGSYDYNIVFMVHRVYICSDLNPHSIMQQYDQVESKININSIMSSSSTLVFKKEVQFQEGGLPMISSTTLKLTTVCFQEGENDEIMHIFAVSGVYIQMTP